MFECNEQTRAVRSLASQTFNICWQFIERDFAFAGEDRETLQDQLAELIGTLMGSNETNAVAIANKAIGILRQQYAVKKSQRVAA